MRDVVGYAIGLRKRAGGERSCVRAGVGHTCADGIWEGAREERGEGAGATTREGERTMTWHSVDPLESVVHRMGWCAWRWRARVGMVCAHWDGLRAHWDRVRLDGPEAGRVCMRLDGRARMEMERPHMRLRRVHTGGITGWARAGGLSARVSACRAGRVRVGWARA